MTRSYLLAGVAVLLSVPAQAQTTTNVSSNQPALKGSPDRMVCKVEEQIGSRLGSKKICLTAQQWRDKHNEHREHAEDIQSGIRSRPSIDPPSNVSGPAGPN